MSDLIFRRIRGRIVPIKLSKEDKKDIKTGAIATGAGLGVATAGGVLYRKTVNASIKFVSASINKYYEQPRVKKGVQMSFDDLVKAQKAREQAGKYMKTAINLEKLTPVIRKTSFGLGTALVSYGGLKLSGALADKKYKKEASAFGATAGAVTSYAFLAGYKPKDTFKGMFQASKQYDLFNKAKNVLIKKFL